MSEPSWRRRTAHRLVTLSRRFAAAFSLSILVVALVAQHVPKVTLAPSVIIGCALAVLSAIVFHLVDLSVQVESVRECLKLRQADELLTLDEVLADAFKTIDKRAGGKAVTLDILALHLENMSRWIGKSLRDSKVGSVHINLLLITDRVVELGKHVPHEVAKACNNIRNDLEIRKQTFEELSRELWEGGQRRELSIETRQYSSVSPMYGIHIAHPVNITYIYLCRHYSTSDVEYFHRVDLAGPTDSDKDLADVFRGTFALYWKLANSATWSIPTPRPVKKRGKANRPEGQPDVQGGSKSTDPSNPEGASGGSPTLGS